MFNVYVCVFVMRFDGSDGEERGIDTGIFGRDVNPEREILSYNSISSDTIYFTDCLFRDLGEFRHV